MKIRRVSFFFFNVLVFLTFLSLSLPIGKLQALSFLVDRTDDIAAASVCDDTAPDDCSLRGAVNKANFSGGDDIIILPAGTYRLTLTGVDEDSGAVGDLDIVDNLTINGAGAKTTIIDGNDTDRVLHIVSAVTIELSDLTIQNGNSTGSLTQEGAGILNQGTLTVTNCLIQNNTTNQNNTVDGGDGGGIYDDGGPFVTCVNSTFSGNSADVGGAVSNGNVATFTNCTISGNTASDRAGGISNFDSLTMLNSTIVNNTAPASMGGGLFNADNIGGQTFLKNTIVADNTGGNCFGTITSQGNNLDSGNTCGFAAAGDLIDTDPMLDLLEDNGGPTPTHALLFGSPAIDAADNNDCPGTDQREFGRPADGDNDGTAVCDIGSFETVCEDGVLSGNEDCDDGNTADGDCCNSICQFEAQGSVCDDGNPATSQDQCDGAGICADTANQGSGGCGLGTGLKLNGNFAAFLFPVLALTAMALRKRRS
jgi:cysteine-rich repeat protein